MKVISKFSEIRCIGNDTSGIKMEDNVIQVEKIGEFYFAEIILDAQKFETENLSGVQTQEDAEEKKYQEALEIVLNNDPHAPFTWSGCTLGEILKNDRGWFVWAKKNLRNTYIRGFVELICKRNEI